MPSISRLRPVIGKSPKSVVNFVIGGQFVSSTRSSRPQSCSRRGPWRWMKWPCGMSLGKRSRSTSSTSRPLRASSIAVAAPAHRAPMTIASYVFATLTHDGGRVTRRSAQDRGAREPGPAQPRDHLRLLAARGVRWRRAASRARTGARSPPGPRARRERRSAARTRSTCCRTACCATATCCTRCASFGRWLLRRGLLDRGSRLGRLMSRLHTPFDAVELASDAVARGNRKVFEEIGYEFARYLEADDLDTFLAGLREGDPPDGQALLRAAFTRYAGAARRRRRCCSRTWRSGCTSRPACSPRSARRWTPPTRPRRTSAGGCARTRARACAARPRRSPRPPSARSTRSPRELITRSLMVLSVPGRILALGADARRPLPRVAARADRRRAGRARRALRSASRR